MEDVKFNIINKSLEIVDTINEKIYNSLQNKNEFADFIFEITKEFYEAGMTSKLKPKSEFTVFSSIILQNENDFKIISFANGTKSLPNKNYKFNEFQIYDCHAEILVSRALKLFLVKCLIYNLITISNINMEDFIYQNKILSKEELENFRINSNFFQIFDFIQTNKKIRLKINVHFHLYISEIPCGDCSIFPIVYENKNELNQTGSKTIREVLEYISDANNLKLIHDNNTGMIRSKSMRNDTAKENLSFSLSCSDKLMFKNIFGIQGKYLSNFLYRIDYSTITLSLSNKNLIDQDCCLKSIIRGMSLIRRNKFYQGDTSIKALFNEPKICLTKNNLIDGVNVKNIDKNTLSFSAYWYYGKLNFSKIDPVTGFKQGTNFSENSKPKTLERCRVDLSKIDMLKAITDFLEIYSNCQLFSNFKIDRLIKKLNQNSDELKDKFNHLRQIMRSEKYFKLKSILINFLEISEFLKLKN